MERHTQGDGLSGIGLTRSGGSVRLLSRNPAPGGAYPSEGEHMNAMSRWTVALAVAFTASLSSAANAADPVESREAAARAKDKGWTPATVEVALIQVGDARMPGAL